MFAFFTQRVYLQLFVLYAAGIALGYQLRIPSEIVPGELGWIVVLLACLTGLWWFWRDYHLLSILLLTAVSLIAGMISITLAIQQPLQTPLRAAVNGDQVYLRGKVASIPKYQRGHLRFLMDVEEALAEQGGYAPLPGRVFVFIKCEPEFALYYRDRIRLRAELKEVEPPLNRGQFNYRRYLMQRGTVLTAYGPSEWSVKRLSHPNPVWLGLYRARQKVLSAITDGLPPELGQLTASVIYGDKVTELPEELEERFRHAGLTHILVASGTQISLLILILGLLWWRIGDASTWRGRMLVAARFGLTLAVVLAYATVTGFETSIVRALIMGGVVLLGQALGRSPDGMTALAQAGLVLLLLNPLELLAPGFQLSFSATFGLIYIAGVAFPMVAGLQGWKHSMAQMLLTTAGAQLFVAPILAAQFNQLSVWGMASNFAAIPTAFVLLLAGAASSLGLVYLPVIGLLLRCAILGLSWLLNAIASVFAALPGSNIAVPTPSWWWLVACYALLLLVGEHLKQRQAQENSGSGLSLIPRPLAAISLMLTLVLIAPVAWWLLVPRPELTILALPRSEGYLWRSDRGHTVLMLRSAGLEMHHNAETVVSALRCRGINRLHALVWLDEAPDESLVKDYVAPEFDPYDRLPPELKIGRMPAASRAYGFNLVHERKSISIVSELPGQLPDSPGLLVFSPSVWEELPEAVCADFISRCQVVVAPTEGPIDGVITSDHELTLVDKGAGFVPRLARLSN